jgi:hypothetical protein
MKRLIRYITRHFRRKALEDLYWCETIGAGHRLMQEEGYTESFTCFYPHELFDERVREIRLKEILEKAREETK